jgi:hypothetical protein
MNTESIVKLFILFGTLYLFMKCLNNQENFDAKKYNLKKPAQLTFLNNEGVSYYLVSLEQFKKNYRDKLIKYINEKLKDPKELKLDPAKFNFFNPMPMFLVRSIDLEKYASADVSNFYIIPFQDKFGFVPKIDNKPTPDEYVYTDKNNMLMYSTTYNIDKMLNIDKMDELKPNSIKPLQIDDLTVYVFDTTGQKNIKYFIKQ